MEHEVAVQLHDERLCLRCSDKMDLDGDVEKALLLQTVQRDVAHRQPLPAGSHSPRHNHLPFLLSAHTHT